MLSRARLLRKLSRPAALVVIRGSSGCGKTTLLAEWARQQSGALLWLDLGEALSAPLPFWRAVLQGVRDAGTPARGTALPAALESLDAHARVPLIQAGLRGLDHPVVLALDGAESLTPQTVRELLAVLAVVPTLTVGVATRERGQFESPEVRLAVDSIVVDGAELEFTAAETAAVLSAAGLPDDAETVRLVRQASAGHPRATRAVLSAPSWPDRPSAEELAGHVLAAAGWTDTRMLELAQADGALFAFALQASVVDELPLGLAEKFAEKSAEKSAENVAEGIPEPIGTATAGTPEVPQHPDATALLGRAERLGLGGWSGDASARVFHFTPLVRGILRRELGKQGDADEACRTAIGWLLENGSAESAFLLAALNVELELASLAGAQCFLSLVSSRADEVRVVLSPIPVQTMRSYPVLAMLLAISLNQIARLRPRALEYFAIMLSGANAVRPMLAPTEVIALDAMVSVALRVTAQSGRAARAAASAVAGFAALDEEGREKLGHLGADVMVHAGLSLLYGGEPDAALAAFQRCRQPVDSAAGLHAMSVQAGTHALMGEMSEAAAIVAEGRTRQWPRGWSGSYVGSFYQLAQALLAIEALEFGAAQAHISVVDGNMATLEHWAFFAEAQARLDLYSGAPIAGINRLQLTRHRRRGRTDIDARGSAELDIAVSTLYLAAGNVQAAEASLPSMKRPGMAVLVARARLELVRDAPEAALALIAEAGRLPATLRLQAELAALRSAVRLRLGRPEEARSALESLAATLDGSGLVTPLALLPVEDLRDLRALAATGGSELAVKVLGQSVPAVLRRIRTISLSERERVVLRELMATGSVPAIAERLFVSTNTVKSQLRSLYRKLGVGSRDEVLVVAAAQRLLDGPAAS
ncbi:hypothetical protein AWU67_16200 [Microterricola viridarii]|uniref:HTH luxR-type domain-containing protein n=1 Tax=Microterricola viridarii TaxID=412690 RepID=A0A0Y0Q9G3_9MICO|nr:hypothetical protein AWU67_16200 [Microterricola viridarii]